MFSFCTSIGLEVWLMLLCLILSAVAFFTSSRRKKLGLPPGPWGVPVFGYYPFIGKYPHLTFKRLGEKYGNVIGFYIGSQYVVVLNDWNSVKDALGQDATTDRPSTILNGIPFDFGISSVNGKLWREIRRLSSRAMKQVVDKNFEELLQQEASQIVQRTLEHSDSPIDAEDFFGEIFASYMTALFLGLRPTVGCSLSKMVYASIMDIMQNSATFVMSNFSAELGRLLHWTGVERQYPLAEKLQDFGKFVSDGVDSKISKAELDLEKSFTEYFHEEVENQTKNKDRAYTTEKYLKGTILSFITGGTDTTVQSLIWTLVAIADHPEIQRKAQEELDLAGAPVLWSDRFKIPYTYATFLESMRWRTTVHFPTMRMVVEDMQLQGYRIPKGTFIATNFWMLHNDPKYWTDPERFIPERFLEEDGKEVKTSPESFSPFSYGKRNCPGKLLALMVNLQIFTSLLHRFRILPKDGHKVKYESFYGLTHKAVNVELRFVPRFK